MSFCYGTMHINSNKSVEFITNTAQALGGAIYIESGASPSIIVDKSAELLFFNNTAFQGGALYVIPSSFTIKVEYQSSVKFVNNTALDIGGAVYSEMQSAAPCLFTVIDYSAKIDFTGNHANRSIGHHMYGTSVRDYKCDQQNLELAHQQTKSYCWYSIDAIHKHINISFDPGLNETLSPVSSAPQRVCLCDSNGKPQCARLSQIFTTISIYRGETFSLSAYIVGYDFGTTVGVVHAGFLNSNHFSQLDKSQYNQPISNSETCSPFNYTVYSKRGNELLLLQQMSALPVSAYIGNQSTDYDINGYNYYKGTINYQINNYNSNDQFGCIKSFLLTTPIFINITLLPGCPPGLTLNYNHTECGCHLALSKMVSGVQYKTKLVFCSGTTPCG